MSESEYQRNEVYKNRLALLAAMLENGNTEEVVKADHLSSQNLPGGESAIDLTGVCGGSGWYHRPTKEVDPYLKLRMAK